MPIRPPVWAKKAMGLEGDRGKGEKRKKPSRGLFRSAGTNEVVGLDQLPTIGLGDGISSIIDPHHLEYVSKIAFEGRIADGEEGSDLLG